MRKSTGSYAENDSRGGESESRTAEGGQLRARTPVLRADACRREVDKGDLAGVIRRGWDPVSEDHGRGSGRLGDGTGFSDLLFA